MKIEKLDPGTISYFNTTRSLHFIIPSHIKLLTNSIKIYLHRLSFHKFNTYEISKYITELTAEGLKITPQIPDGVKMNFGCIFEFYLKAEQIVDGVKLTIFAKDYGSTEEDNGNHTFYSHEDCKEIGNI